MRGLLWGLRAIGLLRVAHNAEYLRCACGHALPIDPEFVVSCVCTEAYLFDWNRNVLENSDRVPARYLRILRAAATCDGPGFDINLAHWFTAKLQSPRVKHVRYIRAPMSIW